MLPSTSLRRFVAFLLVPCLVVDPSTAALARPVVWRAVSAFPPAKGAFATQAITPELIADEVHPITPAQRIQFIQASSALQKQDLGGSQQTAPADPVFENHFR